MRTMLLILLLSACAGVLDGPTLIKADTPMGNYCVEACAADAGHMVSAGYETSTNMCVCYGPRGQLPLTPDTVGREPPLQLWKIPAPPRKNEVFACR